MQENYSYADEKVEVIRKGDFLELKYLKPHLVRLKASDRQAIANEVVRMLQMRTLMGKKYFVQKIVGKIIGVSGQMVNRRWQVFKKEGLVALLSGNWEKSKITPTLLRKLEQLSVSDPFLSAEQILEILTSEGICEDISLGTIFIAQRQMDGRRILKLMRKKAAKAFPEVFMQWGYLIQRLFKIIDSLFSRISPKTDQDKASYRVYSRLKSYYKRVSRPGMGPHQKDCYKKRVKLERDKKRNRGFLLRILSGARFFSPECPDCHSKNVKFKFQRERSYKGKKGEIQQGYSRVYKCQNSDCSTNYYTVPPQGVELYARVHREVKAMVFRWFFHLYHPAQ